MPKMEWIINNTGHLSVGVAFAKIRRREMDEQMLDPRLQPKAKDEMAVREVIARMNQARDDYRWRRDRRIVRKIRREDFREEQLVWLCMYKTQQEKDDYS